MKDFVWASRLLGSRFDLVQAGGGNTSLKQGENLIVKASGLSIGEISEDEGFATLSLPILRQALFDLLASDYKNLSKKELEKIGNDILTQSKVSGGRPSIETFFHAVFKKYTFHTHPVAVNYFVSSAKRTETLKSLYADAYFADYATPGVELLLAMADFIEAAESSDKPTVVFLQNHGVIVSCDDANEAIRLTDQICATLEKKAGLSLDSYRQSGELFELLYQEFEQLEPVYPVMDRQLSQAFVEHIGKPLNHFCPDVFIYLGAEIFALTQYNHDKIDLYNDKFGTFPTIFCYQGNTFIRAKNYKKLKETEDMLRFYIQVCGSNANLEVASLSQAEIAYLGHWDAEKFRQGKV
jgi:ribulose-5-phosphate 4-epimerase/fuculose-1-phosphate aldolase